MELLKILQKKLPKKLLVSFKTFIGISELCDTLFTSSFKIFFNLFRINLNKIEITFTFTFALNGNNAWMVSRFQNCF